MKRCFTIFCSVLLLTGCGSATLPECDFAIRGEPYQWEGRTFHIGKTLVINKRTLELPDEVCELNSCAWKADFNGDGAPDYVLSVAGMGNGRNFGNGTLYIFMSKSVHYQCFKQKYGGFLE